jgi:hypothetical protein
MCAGRYLFHEITLQFNATVFQQIFDFFLEEIETIKDLPGMFPTIVMQPISEIVRVGNNKNGGNPFGFSGDDGPICGTSLPLPLPLHLPLSLPLDKLY